MNEIVVILLGLIVISVVVALAFWAVAWISFGVMALFGLRRGRPKQMPPELFQARRREPQFDVLAAHFGAPVPESLHRLYRNMVLLEQEQFYLTDPDDLDPGDCRFISRFLPADQQALEGIPCKMGDSLFPFAEDGLGNYYCVPIRGEAEDRCPVYFWDHQAASTPGEMRIADSLDEFLARPQRPGPAAGVEP